MEVWGVVINGNGYKIGMENGSCEKREDKICRGWRTQREEAWKNGRLIRKNKIVSCETFWKMEGKRRT